MRKRSSLVLDKMARAKRLVTECIFGGEDERDQPGPSKVSFMAFALMRSISSERPAISLTDSIILRFLPFSEKLA